MKRKKLKTIGQLKALADRKLQDYFRNIKEKCELCYGKYKVAHHFIHKSQSNYLRYDEKNLVFCCQSCHSKFHSFPDSMYPIIVRNLRGKAWEVYIEKHRHLLKKDDRKELEEIIERYS